MKKIIILILCILSSLGSLMVKADGLDYESCTPVSQIVYHCFYHADFNYPEGIELIDENAVAYLYQNDELIATGTCVVINHTGWLNSKTGTLSARFDQDYVFPIGDVCRVEIPENTIRGMTHQESTNPKIVYSFSIPEFLEEPTSDIDSRDIITDLSSVRFFWPQETEALNQPKLLLSMNGIVLREYDLDVTWDWNLGQTSSNFANSDYTALYFQAGTNYSLTIPQGSVCGLDRNDIVNTEITRNFIGGCTDEFPSIDLVSCSLLPDETEDKLEKVNFVFNCRCLLSPSPKVRLLLCEDRSIAAEAVPTIETGDSGSTMTVDFGNLVLEKGKTYMVQIPEGTVSYDGPYVIANNEENVFINADSKVRQTSEQEPTLAITAEGGRITGIGDTDKIVVYSSQGTIMHSVKPCAGEANFILPRGLYIIKVKSRTYKINI